MRETGEQLKSTRLVSGISLEEVSNDLNIPVIELEQIEDGSFGAFEDVYDLKRKLVSYAKYIGLNTELVINKFNEYMFDYTSRISVNEIADAIKTKNKENKKIEENRVASPYTKYYPKEKTLPYVIAGIVIFILVILAIVWSVTQITGNEDKTNVISYVDGGPYEFTK